MRRGWELRSADGQALIRGRGVCDALISQPETYSKPASVVKSLNRSGACGEHPRSCLVVCPGTVAFRPGDGVRLPEAPILLRAGPTSGRPSMPWRRTRALAWGSTERSPCRPASSSSCRGLHHTTLPAAIVPSGSLESRQTPTTMVHGNVMVEAWRMAMCQEAICMS